MAPSVLVSGIAFIVRLLVTPVTTTFPNSSNSTTTGLVLTSLVSVNCTLATLTLTMGQDTSAVDSFDFNIIIDGIA